MEDRIGVADTKLVGICYLCSNMADIHKPEIRSYNMSRIRGENTKPEILVRKFLFYKGFRYRLYNKSLPGKPDIVLPKYKTIIFIHGCFWHGHHGCKYSALPKTRTEWWREKIQNTIVRDEKNEHELKNRGWKIIIVWTCELKGEAKNQTFQRLIKEISGV